MAIGKPAISFYQLASNSQAGANSCRGKGSYCSDDSKVNRQSSNKDSRFRLNFRPPSLYQLFQSCFQSCGSYLADVRLQITERHSDIPRSPTRGPRYEADPVFLHQPSHHSLVVQAPWKEKKQSYPPATLGYMDDLICR
jgi:hypothetical protein